MSTHNFSKGSNKSGEITIILKEKNIFLKYIWVKQLLKKTTDKLIWKHIFFVCVTWKDEAI